MRSGWLSVMRRCCLPRRWPGFDSRSHPDLRLEWKRWLFSVTLHQGARSQGLQLRFNHAQVVRATSRETNIGNLVGIMWDTQKVLCNPLSL
jgi:hypothetical protein